MSGPYRETSIDVTEFILEIYPYLRRIILRWLILAHTNLLNSTVNPQGNPCLYIPPDWAESNPNMSVSGFIDEWPYTGPGTHLQSQREGIQTRINKIMDGFQKLKMKINEWERSLKNQTVSRVEINQQFSSLSKVITKLSN